MIKRLFFEIVVLFLVVACISLMKSIAFINELAYPNSATILEMISKVPVSLLM